MGKRIKSTGVILDASSMASAPVSPTGTVALRAKSDSTQFQYSANGGAWTDFGGSGVGSVRLDQVLDPIDPIVTPLAGVKAFAMGSNQLAFTYTGADAEDCMVIQSTTDAPGSGSVLLLRTLGASTTKSPLRIEGRGAFYFSVGVDGKVAIGAEAGLVHKLNVYHTNSGGSSVGIIHGATTLASGNTAVTISNAEIRLDDTGNTTALLAMTNLELDLDRDSSSVANSSLVCTNISASSNINANTLTVRNLALSIQVHNSATVTNWEAIRITAPSTFGGGVLTNKRAIITESGAGNVGFGTLTPSAQLHVSGTVQLDLGSDATGDVFYRSSGGTLTRLGVGTNGHVLTLAAGLPSWAAAPGGGGGSPGGSATELQYRSGASTFGAVTNSAVSGANVTMGGTLSLDAAGSLDQSIVLSAIGASDTKITFTEYRGAATPVLLQFDRSRGTQASPTNLSSDDIIGELKFRGRVSGAFAQLGYLRGAYSSTDGGTVQLGVGATSGSGTRFVATVSSGAGIFDTGGNFFTVSGSGFQFSHGATGAIYYRSAGGLFTALTIGSTSQYLKGGTIPSWGGIDAGHITAGQVPLANGGTAANLTDPGGDRILFWDDSAGVVTWLTASTGLTITGTNMTASGGTPAGSGSELQFRNAGAFGAVTNSVVSGANLTLGGSLTIDRAADANFKWLLSSLSGADVSITGTFNATSANPILIQMDRARGTGGTNLSTLDYVGRLLFRGRVGGALTQLGKIDVQYTTNDPAGVMVLGVGSAATTSITMGEGTSFGYLSETAMTTFSNSVTQMDTKTLNYSGAAAAGFGMREVFQLKSSDTASRLAAALDTRWQVATDASRSAVMSLRTVHKAQTVAYERALYGGYKALTDNTRTDIFSLVFGTTDHKAVAGLVHLSVVAKQITGSVQVQLYRKTIAFVAVHNGTNNTGTARWGNPFSTEGLTTTGGITFVFECNTVAYPTFATGANTMTFQLTADSDLTTISEFWVQYNIEYNGEADIVLA